MDTATLSKISLDIVSLIVLVFLVYLISRNTVLTNESTKNFNIITGLTIIMILTEIITIILDVPNSSFRIPNMLANVIGFSITPVISVRLAYLYDEDLMKHRWILTIPLIINACICMLSSYTGWIFKISQENQYNRGPLFFLFVLCSLYGFCVLVYANHKNASKYHKGDKIYLYGLYFVVVIGTVIQIIFPELLTIWGCVSASLILYYIFIRELQFKYDTLTNMLNRQAFEREMEDLTKLNEATVWVFDLNNLKTINDTYGHRIGDLYIIQAAEIIKECFEQIGKSYRIGGDEFCVLSKVTENSQIQMSEEMMVKRIKEDESMWNDQFNIAFGYALYNKRTMSNIYNAFTEADKRMYLHKELSKQKKDG